MYIVYVCTADVHKLILLPLSPSYEYLYQRHHNQQTSSTREAKNLAKALVRRDSELFPLK